MSALFMKEGNTFSVTTGNALDLHNKLPVGTYALRKSLFRGFYLEQMEGFELPKTLYGDVSTRAERILSTFDSRPNSTGVLLCGEKGSGKTLLSKLISQMGLALDISTLVINSPFVGDDFNNLIGMINQPLIILFDEFEKVYNKESQHQLLTLFDGTVAGKKLFILTANSDYEIVPQFKNRPGRLFYSIDFKGLEDSFVNEYCEKNLLNKEFMKAITLAPRLFGIFTFDMLQALVEEVNRYNESPSKALQLLNMKPTGDGNSRYAVRVFIDDKELPEELIETQIWTGNVVTGGYVEFYRDAAKKEESNYTSIHIDANNMTKMDPETQTYHFTNERGYRFILKRKTLETRPFASYLDI